MKNLIYVVFVSMFISSFSQAFPYAQCQVELLKVATAALESEFKNKAAGVDFFKDISINFNEPLRPKAVFFGEGKPGARKYCLVQVMMKIPEERFPADHCPKYEVDEFDTNCP